jgi:hypothetical protein
VNGGIPKQYCGYPAALTYPKVDDLTCLINDKARGQELPVLLFKTDLSRAYRQLYLDPRDINLLGYQWKDAIYIDVTYPFGIRSAAINCQRVTNTATAIYHRLYGNKIINYLDDLAGCETQERASDAYHKLLQLMEELGLELSPDKSQPPATQMVFLGILINTETMTLSVPQHKIDRALATIKAILHRKALSKKQLQSLLGSLVHLATCVKPGRLFVSRLINLLKQDAFPVTVDSEFQLDLIWWQTFAGQFNGTSLITDNDWSEPDSVLSTDSCLTGCGGILYVTSTQCEYFHRTFPECVLEQGPDINYLELLTVVAACKLWGQKLQRKKIVVYCDNTQVVLAVNSGKTSSQRMQAALRELWYVQARNNCVIRTRHIPGSENRIADHLSRMDQNSGQKTAFEQLTKGWIIQDCEVPDTHFMQDFQPHYD